ncbi:hypothetical protein BR93DRAFT_344107 [Coniochaeta sp. PMI_546]|nr:hypothetical protein BR93DRAFT_344107 [Coniochaeta sp. PMI_546]
MPHALRGCQPSVSLRRLLNKKRKEQGFEPVYMRQLESALLDNSFRLSRCFRSQRKSPTCHFPSFRIYHLEVLEATSHEAWSAPVSVTAAILFHLAAGYHPTATKSCSN